MTYKDLLKNAPAHDKPEFIEYLRRHNKVVQEGRSWIVIENFKYHTKENPWYTAFYKRSDTPPYVLFSLYKFLIANGYKDWEWLKKAAHNQTVKRFHIHLIKQ